MTRHHSLLTLFALPLAVTAAGCVMETEETSDLGQIDSAIVNGEPYSSQAQAAYGIGLTDAGCTMTFLEANVALTTKDCAATSKTVEVDGAVGKIRTVHELIDGQRDAAGDVVAVTLKRGVPLAANPFGRRVDKTAVAQGEVLFCFGFTNGKLRAGPFEVGDSAGHHLSLHGRWTTYGVAEVDKEDLGGFCVRDGAASPVAILVGPTDGGVASALRLLDYERGVRGAVELGEVVRHGAIRLADETFSDVITASLGTSDVTFDPIGSTDDRHQAFYREPLQSGSAVRLVEVATGDCLTRDGGAMVMKACGNSGQTFEEHWQLVGGDGFYAYEEHGSGEAIDRSTSPLGTSPWASLPEQQFKMGLTFF